MDGEQETPILNTQKNKADQLPFQEKLQEGYADAQLKVGAYLQGEAGAIGSWRQHLNTHVILS